MVSKTEAFNSSLYSYKPVEAELTKQDYVNDLMQPLSQIVVYL